MGTCFIDVHANMNIATYVMSNQQNNLVCLFDTISIVVTIFPIEVSICATKLGYSHSKKKGQMILQKMSLECARSFLKFRMSNTSKNLNRSDKTGHSV